MLDIKKSDISEKSAFHYVKLQIEVDSSDMGGDSTYLSRRHHFPSEKLVTSATFAGAQTTPKPSSPKPKLSAGSK